MKKILAATLATVTATLATVTFGFLLASLLAVATVTSDRFQTMMDEHRAVTHQAQDKTAMRPPNSGSLPWPERDQIKLASHWNKSLQG